MSGPQIINGVEVWGLRTTEEEIAHKEWYDKEFARYTAEFRAMTDEELINTDNGYFGDGALVNTAYIAAREQVHKERGLSLR